MTGIFGILESSATKWYQDVAPTQEFFFSSSHVECMVQKSHAERGQRNRSLSPSKVHGLRWASRTSQNERAQISCDLLSVQVPDRVLGVAYVLEIDECKPGRVAGDPDAPQRSVVAKGGLQLFLRRIGSCPHKGGRVLVHSVTILSSIPQTTDMNLGQVHCLSLRAPILDLWLVITENRKFVVQGFIWMTKF